MRSLVGGFAVVAGLIQCPHHSIHRLWLLYLCFPPGVVFKDMTAVRKGHTTKVCNWCTMHDDLFCWFDRVLELGLSKSEARLALACPHIFVCLN